MLEYLRSDNLPVSFLTTKGYHIAAGIACLSCSIWHDERNDLWR